MPDDDALGQVGSPAIATLHCQTGSGGSIMSAAVPHTPLIGTAHQGGTFLIIPIGAFTTVGMTMSDGCVNDVGSGLANR